MNFDAKRVKNTNSEYHADKDILSSSMLKSALISPLKFIHSLTTHIEPTPSMMYGTLMHALITEPEAVNDIVALSPQPLARDAASRLFREANPGRLCMWLPPFLQVHRGERLRAQHVLYRPNDGHEVSHPLRYRTL